MTNLPDQLSFAAAHPVAQHPPQVLRKLLTELTRGPEGVLDLRLGQDRLLAALIERVETSTGAAILELMGLDATSHASELLDRALTWAEGLLVDGPARAIEVPLPVSVAHLAPVLRARGYALDHTGCEMATPDGYRPPPRAPLPFELRWEDVAEARITALHAVSRAAFAGQPGVALTDLETFRAMTREAAIPARLLLAGERVVGFASLVLHDGAGLVRSIGRDPSWRGRGLGPLLMDEALAVLAARGATRMTLSVLATNDAALSLYRRFGFQVVSEEPVYLKALGAHSTA